MTNYEGSMFENQDDLVERAVAWLCQASEDAGEDAGQWARTLALVEGRLDTLREAACGEVRRAWIVGYRETHGVWPFAGPVAEPPGRHVAVVHVVLDDVDELDADQVAEVLARDLVNDGYVADVVDVLVLPS